MWHVCVVYWTDCLLHCRYVSTSTCCLCRDERRGGTKWVFAGVNCMSFLLLSPVSKLVLGTVQVYCALFHLCAVYHIYLNGCHSYYYLWVWKDAASMWGWLLYKDSVNDTSIRALLSAYDTIVYWTWRATWTNRLFWTALCMCTMCTIRCGLQLVGDIVCYPRAQERLQQAHRVCEKGWRDRQPRTRWAIVDMWPVLPGILQFFHLLLPLMNCGVYSEAATTYFASPFIKCSINLRVATKQGRASIYVNICLLCI